MSENSQITPNEVINVIRNLPPCEAIQGENTPFARASAFIDQTDKGALITRMFLYRFDATGGKHMAQSDAFQANLTASNDTALHRACATMNADLQLFELGAGDASAEDNARAVAFGLMASEEGTGMVMATSFGAHNAPNDRFENIEDLFKNTTPETAALFGVMASCARANIPFIGEGARCLTAAHALHNLRPDLTQGIFLCGVDAHDVPVTTFNDINQNETLGLSAAILGSMIQTLSLSLVKAAA